MMTTTQGVDVKLTKQDFAAFQAFFTETVLRTFAALPFHFQIPVKLAHIPMNVETICGKNHRVFGALVCAGANPHHVEIDFRFALECWLARDELKLAAVLCHELAHIVVRSHGAAHSALFQFFAMTAMIKLKPPKSLEELAAILPALERATGQCTAGGEIVCSEAVTMARFLKPGSRDSREVTA